MRSEQQLYKLVSVKHIKQKPNVIIQNNRICKRSRVKLIVFIFRTPAPSNDTVPNEFCPPT